MPRVEDLLLEGESVAERLAFGGVTVAVTNLGLIVRVEGAVASVNPVHVVGVGFGYALEELLSGIALILISITLMYIDLGELAYYIAALLYLLGLALAAYGWLYRYRLTISYVGGRVELRGGGSVPRAARRLRRVILDVLEARAQAEASARGPGGSG